jgi:hypothetical protein
MYRVRMPDHSRWIIAVLVVGCLVFSAAATWGFEAPTAAGFSLRTAVILGALWLAWPELTQRSFRKTAIIALGVLVVLFRPRTAWVVIPAFLLWLGTNRR